MLSHLQVKVWNLGQEARYIRSKEQKWKERARTARAKMKDPKFAESNFWSLREHRMGLRRASRHAQLAYGFIRGRSYANMENLAYSQPDWNEIEKLVKRFSSDDPRIEMQHFAEWVDSAKNWQKAVSTAAIETRAMKAKAKVEAAASNEATNQV